MTNDRKLAKQTAIESRRTLAKIIKAIDAGGGNAEAILYELTAINNQAKRIKERMG